MRGIIQLSSIIQSCWEDYQSFVDKLFPQVVLETSLSPCSESTWEYHGIGLLESSCSVLDGPFSNKDIRLIFSVSPFSSHLICISLSLSLLFMLEYFFIFLFQQLCFHNTLFYMHAVSSHILLGLLNWIIWVLSISSMQFLQGPVCYLKLFVPLCSS